ncbi:MULTISPECIES: MOSC domain-containing protein [unclassified Coleofasciculus]|uniref:MOSC domain-containing protein n=1 Tax=unclassified Coleofasciculus TaxID=2692782 RepID=UPI001882A57D|nr:MULTISPECIES: MOSC domain-containing protein [unclassified Coleofasciculus]MBE9126634.1 MOSC domain-containing protein [Coleofasciculus sp. LEGE 07081]MBE9148886.1 MOSC domain-containing protein [Coleofasciculus sp. LEGE 07092]
MAQIKLSGIYIYPIKSAGGISLETSQVGTHGFQYDRRWMLVDERGKFLTQRQLPHMALIKVQFGEGELGVEAPNQSPLSIPIELESDRPISVQVWNDICDAIPLPQKVNQWFSEFLDIPCQLVYMPENSIRPINPHYANPNEQVSFADGFPFLLISEASLQDLNDRLDQPIPMNRFRPNLVVSGCEAFAEDSWRQIRIGSIPFRVVKPCSRCVITTVDQSQGLRGKEPLVTLAKYRLRDGQIFFGQNLIQEQLGTLRVGEAVEIESFGKGI